MSKDHKKPPFKHHWRVKSENKDGTLYQNISTGKTFYISNHMIDVEVTAADTEKYKDVLE